MGSESSLDEIGNVAVDSEAVEEVSGVSGGSGGSTIWIVVDGFGSFVIIAFLIHTEHDVDSKRGPSGSVDIYAVRNKW